MFINMNFAENVVISDTETVLWENSSPTTQISTTTNITLNESISNFDYLKIYVRFSTSDSSETFNIYSVEEFKKYLYNGSSNVFLPVFGSCQGQYYYCRDLGYVDDTTIAIYIAYRYGYTTTAHAYCIPTKITGIKKERTNIDKYGFNEFEYKLVSVPANTVLNIPTNKKAKGIVYMLASSGSNYYNYIYSCWDGLNNNAIKYNDAVSENYISFNETSIVSSGTISANAKTLHCHIYY